MVESYRLRPTVEADLPQLAELEEVAFTDPWPVAVIAGSIVDPGTIAFVAESKDGELVGSAVARSVVDEGELLSVGVDPDHRRMGLGGRLMSAVLLEMTSRGVATVWLEVRAGNLAAQTMYRRAGFAPAGVRPGYYRNPSEDALLFKLRISE